MVHPCSAIKRGALLPRHRAPLDSWARLLLDVMARLEGRRSIHIWNGSVPERPGSYAFDNLATVAPAGVDLPVLNYVHNLRAGRMRRGRDAAAY